MPSAYKVPSRDDDIDNVTHPVLTWVCTRQVQIGTPGVRVVGEGSREGKNFGKDFSIS